MKKDYETKNLIRTWSTYVPEEMGSEVTKTLSSGWLNTGKKEKELRDKIKQRFHSNHVTACINGTAALKIAYATIGIGPGDEVLSTPFTFIATNTAILELGAKPVFADIDYSTLNIDLESIPKLINNKTKAIVVVHYGGLPVDLDKLYAIGKAYNLPIVEDSAHALGSKYMGRYIGATGDFVTFSLQAVKIVTSGDGGFICTNNESYYKSLKEYTWYGVDRDTKITDPLNPLPNDITKLGYKANMNDITATMACVAMDHLDEQLEIRRKIGETYRNELEGLNSLKLLNYPSYVSPNYQIFPVHVRSRTSFAQHMFENGIQVNVNNRRNDMYTIFGGIQSNLPGTTKADEDVILLPCHRDLSENDVDRIITKIKEFDK